MIFKNSQDLSLFNLIFYPLTFSYFILPSALKALSKDQQPLLHFKSHVHGYHLHRYCPGHKEAVVMMIVKKMVKMIAMSFIKNFYMHFYLKKPFLE